MKTNLIKGTLEVRFIAQGARVASAADKYIEKEYLGPIEEDVADVYEKVEKFLKSSGKVVEPRKIQQLPYIDDGIITGARAHSRYILDDCLVENQWLPARVFQRKSYHTIAFVGAPKNVKTLEARLREQVSLRYPYRMSLDYSWEVDEVDLLTIGPIQEFVKKISKDTNSQM
jgi:hypothetical protein